MVCMFAVTLVALLSGSLAATGPTGGIVRRHDGQGALEPHAEIAIDGHGEVQLNSRGSAVGGTAGGAVGSAGAATVLACDKYYPVSEAGKEECAAGADTILDVQDCRNAAAFLGKATGSDDDEVFKKNTHNQSALDLPKGCYTDEQDVVWLNPTVPPAAEIKGSKICMLEKYVNADTSNACPAGYTKLPDDKFEDCWAAAWCAAGGGFCRHEHFSEDDATFTSDSAPKGCFKDGIGCWNFNHAESESPGPYTNATSVCMADGASPTPVPSPSPAGEEPATS